MTRRVVIAMTLSACMCAYPSIIFSDNKPKQKISREHENSLLLPKKLRRMLSAEMNRIQNGMTVLSIAIPAGRWTEIEKTAQEMKEGYIMKQKLSKEEFNAFLGSLPGEYISKDHEFQKTAGLLMNAAIKHDSVLVTSYFCKLNETCVACHLKHASKRFPDFKKKEGYGW